MLVDPGARRARTRDEPDSRRLLAAIVQSSDDAIISKTLDGRITSWNQGATRIFGYEAQEMVGKPIQTLIPPGQEDEEPAIIARIRAGERIDHYETRRLHKDGHLVDVSLTISPIRDDDGRIVGASKIARDITERLQARLALEESARLRGAVSEAESFSYMVTHDLRTPLRAIEGFSRRLLKTAPGLPPDARQSLDFIVGAVDRMSNTIDGLLQLTRIGRAPVQRVRVDASAAASDILDELTRGSPRKAEVTVQPGVAVEADPALLHVILSNLLENAWKFTRLQPVARIEFGAVDEPGQPLRCFVRDNGIGFEAGDAADLFTAFNRLNPTTEFEGTGIGLATVRRAVERHGGKVSAKGEPGRGATISFTLAP